MLADIIMVSANYGNLTVNKNEMMFVGISNEPRYFNAKSNFRQATSAGSASKNKIKIKTVTKW